MRRLKSVDIVIMVWYAIGKLERQISKSSNKHCRKSLHLYLKQTLTKLLSLRQQWGWLFYSFELAHMSYVVIVPVAGWSENATISHSSTISSEFRGRHGSYSTGSIVMRHGKELPFCHESVERTFRLSIDLLPASSARTCAPEWERSVEASLAS